MKSSLVRLVLVSLGLAAVFSLSGCVTDDGPHEYTTVARFFMESSGPSTFASVVLPETGTHIAVNSDAVFTEYDITHVDIGTSDMGRFLIFQLTSDAARALYRTTGDNQGKRLVLVINGQPVGARLIDSPFSSGAIAIFVQIPDDKLEKLVKNLNLTSADLQKKLAKQRGY